MFTDLVVEVDRNFLSILCTNSGIICSHLKTNVWAISQQHSDLKSCFLCQNVPLNMNNTVAPTTGSDYGNLMFGYSHMLVFPPYTFALEVSLAGTTHT